MRWLLIAMILLGSIPLAHAGRKRVAVLVVEGASGDKVRAELVRVITIAYGDRAR
jgi:hypothetical protein